MAAEARPDGDTPLGRRERSVLAALARGLSTGEAAAELGMGADDVRAALRSAMRALGAATKLEALIKAIRAGLIDAPA